jgi:pimeloyl-ACP methyl ester carboxylesterase
MAFTRSDDLVIRYHDLGKGEPAVLCLPGWCASRHAFDDFADQLSQHRRVIALDWRGHGASDPATADFGAKELLRDALAVIEASGARRIVPLATAHAGWVAIELRRALGRHRIPKLLLADWIVTAAPPPFIGGLNALQDEASWQAVRDQLFAMWTHDVEDPRVLGYVREDMGSYGFDMWSRAGREISAAYARAGSPVEALAKLDPPPPTLHLFASPSGADSLEAQRAFAAAHPWFHVQPLDARSHFPTLEVPDQLIAPIQRFLA